VIDLHLHSTASDGRLRPAELVRQSLAAGLTVISITDHDTVGGLEEARRSANEVGIRLINGIEITAIERGRDVHVLGYFFDSRASALLKFLEGQRQERIRRAREMAARLAQLGYRVDIESLIAALPAGASVGRPALADALVDAGHATGRRDAFDRLLGYGCPAFVPRTGPPLAAVVEKIRTAGGIASLAHPGLTAMDEDIPRFVAAGLSALEARHSDHCPDTEQWYRNLAAALGLVITGGSDFHADPAHHANVLGGVSLSAADFAALEFRAQTLGARVTH
jgi:predicted metal-dependent phosphoesterase TrpH